MLQTLWKLMILRADKHCRQIMSPSICIQRRLFQRRLKYVNMVH